MNAFVNGHVFDGHRYLAGQGLLVAEGRVVAVAPDEEIHARTLPGADVVDLRGGVVLPGFQDAHVHPVQAGVERLRCDLTALETAGEYLQAVRDHLDAHPDRPWVLGGGWAMPAFGPTGPRAEVLDRVAGDRPVFLSNRDHHGAWVSSAALRLAGVDRTPPDPPDGRIERDARGNPTGMLHEGAMGLLERVVPPTTDAELDAGLQVAQQLLHSLGVTAWQDAILGAYAGNADPAAAYRRAVRAGSLTARVRGALWWERERGLEQVDLLAERRAALSGGRLQAGTVKIMQDGIVESRTAALSRPYLDPSIARYPDTGAPASGRGDRGHSFLAPELLAEAVTRLDGEGFQVHVHAIGDRAVTESLDALDRARHVNGPSAGRHHIAHLQIVSPADRPRFAQLDVAANIQALWAVNDEAMTELTLPFIDPELARWQYPFGSLARYGARLAAGSDWPVSTPDPLAAIHVAVNRAPFGVDAPPLLLDEALSVEQAFAAYTSGSAYVNHHEETGRLAPGMVADLAVLDRDPFAGAPEEIGGTRVLATYVEGRVVHEA